MRREHAGRPRHEQDGSEILLLLLQGAACQAVRQEEDAQGAGRGARDDTAAGAVGEPREPRVAGGGRRCVLSR